MFLLLAFLVVVVQALNLIESRSHFDPWFKLCISVCLRRSPRTRLLLFFSCFFSVLEHRFLKIYKIILACFVWLGTKSKGGGGGVEDVCWTIDG